MLLKNHKILLLLILIVSIILRCYKLGSLPSLNPDEAALGYNTYSILETGKDEHGVSWPLHFKSFGDYKPGGYVYLSMPFIKIIGLTPLAVRLPNLILSILSIYFLYRLVLLLSSNSKLAILAGLVLALNPWHIHFSRGAWESSTALSLILIGSYFYFKHKQKFSYIFLSLFLFSLSLYVYHSARIISPLLLFSLIVTDYKLRIKDYKKLFLPILFFIAFSTPVFFSFLKNGGATRFGGVGLTADYGPVSRAEELINHHMNIKLANRIIHNKRLLYFLSWGQKYFSHFDFNFLFLNGDEVPRSKSPEMGQLYLIEFPFLLTGIFHLLKSKKLSTLKLFTLSLLFISPLASSLTFQAPSALRALSLAIPLCILISIGIYKFIVWLLEFGHWKLFGYCFLIIGYLFSLFYFLDAYFVHAPKRYPFAWNTGFNQIIPYIESQKNNYQNIYLTDKYDQPYILYLFFSKYSPKKIQSRLRLTSPDKFGFSTVRTIDNLHFEKINWDSVPQNSLIIASDENIPTSPVDIIYFPNNSPGFKIYIK